MYGTATQMELEIETSIDGGDTWSSPIWNDTGNLGNQWNNASVDLSAYANEMLSFRFLGTTGEIWQGDIGIDNIIVTTTEACSDAGNTCNDGNECTINDVIDSACNCTGTLLDEDGDGVCDTEDVCPGFDDNLIGTSCDDGDSCNVGEVWGTDCNCGGGALLDDNNNGICDLYETCTGTLPESESFESGIGNWTQGSNDDLDWIRDSGGTPSSGTGPGAGSDGSWYMFIEASGNGTGYPNKTLRFLLSHVGFCDNNDFGN